MISTTNLQSLPDIEILEKRCKSLSALDAVLCTDFDDRSFLFDKSWDENKQLATIINGNGDEVRILFNDYGALIHGHAADSEMSPWNNPGKEVWPGVISDIPSCFKDFMAGIPAEIGTTFCIWRKYKDATWKTGKIEFPDDEYGDGSEDLLFLLDGDPETFKQWADEWYDASIPLDGIQKIYNYTKITNAIVESLNPDLDDFETLERDLKQIGYPFHFVFD